MQLKGKRWDIITHSSIKAYNFRRRYIMGPIQKLASITPWYNPINTQDYINKLHKTYKSLVTNADVLEIGCGPGNLSDLLDKFGSKSYIGIDYSMGMVQDAKKEHPNKLFINGNITHLPFPNKSFDIIVSSLTYHHIPPEVRAAATLEQIRVARHAVIIEDLFGFEKGIWRKPYHWYYTITDGCYYRYSLSEWLRMLNSLGLEPKLIFYNDEKMILGRRICLVISNIK